MRPVRFVALSEDGHAFVLADEVGRLLALPIDERVQAAVRADLTGQSTVSASPGQSADPGASLSPRDIQARIRAGESADEVARIAGVPVDRVLRYAGPVLQERAMLAQHARRTRLRDSARGVSLAEIVDGRLGQHGVDAEKIAWDAYRRDDGTWRIVATWPSGKATAQAIWELDKSRQQVTPYDDMAQYLCAERPAPMPGQDLPAERAGRGLAAPRRGESGRGELGRGFGPADSGRESGHPVPEPIHAPAARGRDLSERDPIRSGRDALLASLDRPLTPQEPAGLAEQRRATRPIRGGAFDEDPDLAKEVPAVPSLAVLRPRRASPAAEQATPDERPRKRLPSWDDVLFGTAPTARENSS